MRAINENVTIKIKLAITVVLLILIIKTEKEEYIRYFHKQRGTSTDNEALIVDVWQFPDRCEYVYLCDLGYYQFIGNSSSDSHQYEVGDSIMIKRVRLNPKRSSFHSVSESARNDGNATYENADEAEYNKDE